MGVARDLSQSCQVAKSRKERNRKAGASVRRSSAGGSSRLRARHWEPSQELESRRYGAGRIARARFQGHSRELRFDHSLKGSVEECSGAAKMAAPLCGQDVRAPLNTHDSTRPHRGEEAKSERRWASGLRHSLQRAGSLGPASGRPRCALLQQLVQQIRQPIPRQGAAFQTEFAPA